MKILHIALLALLPVVAIVQGGSANQWPNNLYAFDNGLTRTEPIAEKVRVLKELGYAGVGGRPGKVAEWLKELDREGLQMASLYVSFKATNDFTELSPDLVQEIKLLKGRKTILWLNLGQGEGVDDDLAVRIINEVAEQAKASGLKVALYPHVNCYTETVEDVVRLADKVNRPNVGVSFNLCHFLKTDSVSNLKAVLRKVAPRLMLISVNGTDVGDTRQMNWSRLIQPLGQGTFDNQRLLKWLKAIGYSGPVVLQCYAIKGDDRDNLKKSMLAWRKIADSLRLDKEGSSAK